MTAYAIFQNYILPAIIIVLLVIGISRLFVDHKNQPDKPLKPPLSYTIGLVLLIVVISFIWFLILGLSLMAFDSTDIGFNGATLFFIVVNGATALIFIRPLNEYKRRSLINKDSKNSRHEKS